jgi:methylglutaconyl-CoA hydratase
MPVVLVEKQNPHVSVVTLNRPERRNALTVELMKELIAAVDSIGADDKQRVLILRGAGKCFCAGLDLQETALTQDAHAAAEIVAKTLITLSQTRLITIAAVHGAAVAGGAGIMSTCDFVIAEAHTKFGYPEARRGLVAGLVLTFLRRQLHERHIRELVLTSELIGSQRALEIGLINRIVQPNDLEKELQKLVNDILQNAPDALSNTKRLIEELWSASVKHDVELALKHHMQARESAEAKEGIAAFLEKRPPNWAQ